MRRFVIIAAVLSVLATTVGVSLANGHGDGCLRCDKHTTTGAAGKDDFKVYERSTSDGVDGRDTSHQPRVTTWIEVEEDAVPTCMGNSRGNADALCGPAVNTCPAGEIRFWVWHRTVEYTRQPDGTVTPAVTVPWHQEPRTYCLGADDPFVPPIARVIDQVQSDFASLPLPTYGVRSDPGPTTLVNIDTAFFAGSAEPQTFDPVLLGVPVHVTATPARWLWTWGDGTNDETTTPGVPKQPVVSHEYTSPGDVTVTVVVEWTGTFTVGADPTPIPIAAPARTAAQTTTVRVREARSELVSR